MLTSSRVLRTLAVLAALLVGGCTDTPAPDAAGKLSLGSCQRFDGTVEGLSGGEPGNCAVCTVSNPHNAVDGDLSTFATLEVAALADGSRALRATAQPGTVYAPGTVAVIGEIRKTASAQVMGAGVVRSYLAGAAQDEQVIQDSGALAVNGSGGTGLQAFALKAQQPFDSLQFAVEGSLTTNVTLVVYEFCSAIN